MIKYDLENSVHSEIEQRAASSVRDILAGGEGMF